MGYLASRFDNQLLGDLGFGTFVGFSRHVAEKLGVKENSVKNWRDEFDGLNPDPARKRKGWDRKPTPSRVYMKMQLDSWTYEQLSGLANSVLLRSPDFTPQSVDEMFAWAIAGKDSDTRRWSEPSKVAFYHFQNLRRSMPLKEAESSWSILRSSVILV